MTTELHLAKKLEKLNRRNKAMKSANQKMARAMAQVIRECEQYVAINPVRDQWHDQLRHIAGQLRDAMPTPPNPGKAPRVRG